mmetsp:Transcript_68215/g.134780  ORF Transcript_68215/g.134780 Transcript_68215/m.134780 type:complete len:719 (-) Transcript_68215:145-2301(-)
MQAEATPLFHFPALLARGYKPRQARQALLQANGDLGQAISICEAATTPAARPADVIAPAQRQNAAVEQLAGSLVASLKQRSAPIRDPGGPPVILGPEASQQDSSITSESSALQHRLKVRRAERNKQQEHQAAKITEKNVKASFPVPDQERQNGGLQSAEAAELTTLGEQLVFATRSEVHAILSKLGSWPMKAEQLVETRIGKIVRECCRAHGGDIHAQGEQLLRRWLQVYRSERAPSMSLSGSGSSPESAEVARAALTGSAPSPEQVIPPRREISEVVHAPTQKRNSICCSLDNFEADDSGINVRTPVTPPMISPTPASSGMLASTSKRPRHEAVDATGAESQRCDGHSDIAGSSSKGGVERAPADAIPTIVPASDIDVKSCSSKSSGESSSESSSESISKGNRVAGNKSPLLKRRRLNKPKGSAVAATQQPAVGGVPGRVALTWYDTCARKWILNEDTGSSEQTQAHARCAASAVPQRSKIVKCDAIVQYADRQKVRCARCRRPTKEGTLRVAFPSEQPQGSGRLRSVYLHLSCCAERPRPLQGLSASCVLGISALGPLQKKEANYALGLGDRLSSSESCCNSSRAIARAIVGGKSTVLLRSLRQSHVYQALHAWRKAAAKEARVGPSDVVSDKILVHLAHVAPRAAEELEAVQGLSAFKRSIYRNGILEAVRRGRTAKLEAAKKRSQEDEQLRPSAAKWSAGLARQRMEAGDAPSV